MRESWGYIVSPQQLAAGAVRRWIIHETLEDVNQMGEIPTYFSVVSLLVEYHEEITINDISNSFVRLRIMRNSTL